MSSNIKTYKSNITISLYWKCQLIGWSLVSVYWAYTVYTRDNYGVFYTLLNYLLDVSIGIFLTHIYRALILRSNKNNIQLKKLLLKIVPSVIVLAILYMFLANLKWHYYWSLVAGREHSLIQSLFEWNPVFITGIRLMSIWLLAYHLYHYYINQMEMTKANAQLSVIAKQAQLDNLSAQLNPHFLFNSLNSIKSLVIENPKIARRAIDLLSDLLRSSLYEKDKDLIPIKEELSLVNDYIELEKLRFEERLELKITIDKSLENFKIPTLSIQLLVENAIKHGIDSKIEGGNVFIIITKGKEFVSIQVQNPGVLSLNKRSIGLGLKNLQERLKIQYKGNASFYLVALNDDVVEAKIIIPYTADENI
jgi:two-component system LytT family sensor kinase